MRAGAGEFVPTSRAVSQSDSLVRRFLRAVKFRKIYIYRVENWPLT